MPKAKEPKTYEERIARLEELIAQLEKGDLPLEKSIDCYKEAMTLAALCGEQLSRYRQIVTRIAEDGTEVPFETDGE